MIEAMIVAGCFLAFFSNMDGISGIVRPVIFVLLFGAAFLSVATHKVRRIAPTPAEYLLYLVGLLSAVVSLSRSEDYCIYYTMYYVCIVIFISIFVRTISLERLMDLGALVTVLCAAACVLLQGNAFIAALEISIGPNGLLRYGAFNNHPLLIGYVFGSGSLLLARRVYLARTGLERVVTAAAVLLCWSIVLAASSRSTIVALMAATVVVVFFEFRALKRMTGKRILIATALIVVAAVIYFGFAGHYLADILEIDSSYRGFGTGATGRTDLWAKGMDALLGDPALIAFGGGLRSSEYTVIGFLTENSYLTILLDSGILVGGTLILFLLCVPIVALRREPASGASKRTLAFLPSYFVFLLIQCFFLRYFIGIGNPTSLLTLVYFLSLSMYPAFQKGLPQTPRESVDTPKPLNMPAPMKNLVSARGGTKSFSGRR